MKLAVNVVYTSVVNTLSSITSYSGTSGLVTTSSFGVSIDGASPSWLFEFLILLPTWCPPTIIIAN